MRPLDRGLTAGAARRGIGPRGTAVPGAAWPGCGLRRAGSLRPVAAPGRDAGGGACEAACDAGGAVEGVAGAARASSGRARTGGGHGGPVATVARGRPWSRGQRSRRPGNRSVEPGAATRPSSSDSKQDRFFWSTPLLIETFVEAAAPRPCDAAGLLDEMSGSPRWDRVLASASGCRPRVHQVPHQRHRTVTEAGGGRGPA